MRSESGRRERLPRVKQIAGIPKKHEAKLRTSHLLGLRREFRTVRHGRGFASSSMQSPRVLRISFRAEVPQSFRSFLISCILGVGCAATIIVLRASTLSGLPYQPTGHQAAAHPPSSPPIPLSCRCRSAAPMLMAHVLSPHN